MGAKSQRKGRSGEIELVKILNDNGISAEPGQAVSFGSTPDIVGVDGVHAEVKRVERLNVLEAMNQAIRDSKKFDGTFQLSQNGGIGQCTQNGNIEKPNKNYNHERKYNHGRK